MRLLVAAVAAIAALFGLGFLLSTIVDLLAMVMPVWASSLITSSTSVTISGSRAEVGSSKRMTSGSMARARAMATRCFCPPERVTG